MATTSRAAATILFVAALAQVLGSFFWGPSERLFGRYKLPMLIGVGTCFTSLVLLATLGKLADSAAAVVFAMIGFSTGMTSVVMSHGRSLVAPHLLGRTITLAQHRNHGRRIPGSVRQRDHHQSVPDQAGAYPLEAYRLVFALQAVPRADRVAGLFRQPREPLRPR